MNKKASNKWYKLASGTKYQPIKLVLMLIIAIQHLKSRILVLDDHIGQYYKSRSVSIRDTKQKGK